VAILSCMFKLVPLFVVAGQLFDIVYKTTYHFMVRSFAPMITYIVSYVPGSLSGCE